MNTDMQLNGERYKEDSIEYQKLLKKILKPFSTESLIEELKRRKILKINWNTGKLDEMHRV